MTNIPVWSVMYLDGETMIHGRMGDRRGHVSVFEDGEIVLALADSSHNHVRYVASVYEGLQALRGWLGIEVYDLDDNLVPMPEHGVEE